ncbi:unnamed protein product [Cyprideis torosa]|uniref:Uncharacterized protein n=1 Tax=Cyprideis torosa TaxID=163714 RepID=A0A7R8ZNE6_9CRUS|nr:unnamed protein product [Cyprideis torosa]CAG0891416.1 unnamed protein product [Cyprideis torosa]
MLVRNEVIYSELVIIVLFSMPECHSKILLPGEHCPTEPKETCSEVTQNCMKDYDKRQTALGRYFVTIESYRNDWNPDNATFPVSSHFSGVLISSEIVLGSSNWNLFCNIKSSRNFKHRFKYARPHAANKALDKELKLGKTAECTESSVYAIILVKLVGEGRLEENTDETAWRSVCLESRFEKMPSIDVLFLTTTNHTELRQQANGTKPYHYPYDALFFTYSSEQLKVQRVEDDPEIKLPVAFLHLNLENQRVNICESVGAFLFHAKGAEHLLIGMFRRSETFENGTFDPDFCINGAQTSKGLDFRVPLFTEDELNVLDEELKKLTEEADPASFLELIILGGFLLLGLSFGIAIFIFCCCCRTSKSEEQTEQLPDQYMKLARKLGIDSPSSKMGDTGTSKVDRIVSVSKKTPFLEKGMDVLSSMALYRPRTIDGSIEGAISSELTKSLDEGARTTEKVVDEPKGIETEATTGLEQMKMSFKVENETEHWRWRLRICESTGGFLYYVEPASRTLRLIGMFRSTEVERNGTFNPHFCTSVAGLSINFSVPLFTEDELNILDEEIKKLTEESDSPPILEFTILGSFLFLGSCLGIAILIFCCCRGSKSEEDSERLPDQYMKLAQKLGMESQSYQKGKEDTSKVMGGGRILQRSVRASGPGGNGLPPSPPSNQDDIQLFR